MEITQEAWASWKTQPITLEFFKYIEDFRENVAKEVAMSIAEGELMPHEIIEELTARCRAYVDIEDLDFDTIDEFYNPKEDEDDGTSDTEQGRPDDRAAT